MSRSVAAPLSHWYHAYEAVMDADRAADKAAIACAASSSPLGTLDPCFAYSDKGFDSVICVLVVTMGSPPTTGAVRIESRRAVRFINVDLCVCFGVLHFP